jgi:hypothetical protein
MNKIAAQISIVALSIVMGSCSMAFTDRADQSIKAGEHVDDMLFTTINEMNWDISLIAYCDFETAEDTGEFSKVNCSASKGDNVFFGNCNGVWFDDPNEADNLWRELELEFTFDGKKINLPTFSFMDIDLYDSDKEFARIWNLMVENISPGTHIIECKEGSGGVTETRTFLFSVSE